MNELRPFQPKSHAPLTGGARFIRGFTRIGAVVAVLVALIGVPASIASAVSTFNSAADSHRSAQCIARLARSGYTFKKKYEYSSALDYSVGGCNDYYHSYQSVGEVIAMADSPAPTFLTSDGASYLGWGLVVTGILAVAAYLIFWCIGWVFAGFTRDT
ncbi:hypothetical protein ACVILK_005519 [Bradyrhizobium embrapense]